MDELTLKKLWQSSNEKWESSFDLLQKNTEDITKLKAKDLISSMTSVKLLALAVGIIWIVVVGSIISWLAVYAFEKVSLFFLFSAALQVIITAIAVVVYLYQVVLIQQVDISEPIITTQECLAKLSSSTLWATRILFLQLPLWTTFYLHSKMFEAGNIGLLFFQIIITLAFAYAAIWLFNNINPKNQDKKWFKWLFSGKEWQPILDAMKLLQEIEQYKVESK